MQIGVKPGQWGWSFAELTASWRAAEEAGFDLLSCFDHVSASEDGPAWDAPTLLASMASETERIGLAVHVLNCSLRNPVLLAGQLAVAQAASRGRLQVGLGTGSGFAREDHQVTGIPFPPFAERVARLESCCRTLPALWRGEKVTDEEWGLSGASLGPLAIDPPSLIVGGESDRVLEVAARHAHVWNGFGGEPARFAERAERLDRLREEIGRRDPILKEAQVFASSIGLSELRGHLEVLEQAGCQRVVVVLHEERGHDTVWRLAEALF